MVHLAFVRADLVNSEAYMGRFMTLTGIAIAVNVDRDRVRRLRVIHLGLRLVLQAVVVCGSASGDTLPVQQLTLERSFDAFESYTDCGYCSVQRI